MARYKKKPLVINAAQWKGGGRAAYLKLCKDIGLPEPPDEEPGAFVESYPEGGKYWAMEHWPADDTLTIRTLEGKMVASIGDWVIVGVRGELYPCKPDIFEATYEEARSPGPPVQLG